MQAHEYEPMLKMILSHKLEPKKLINKTVTLEESANELMAMGNFNNVGVTVIDKF
jgi:alcohol dehydrogenase